MAGTPKRYFGGMENLVRITYTMDMISPEPAHSRLIPSFFPLPPQISHLPRLSQPSHKLGHFPLTGLALRSLTF
jgi:hypothetical protein